MDRATRGFGLDERVAQERIVRFGVQPDTYASFTADFAAGTDYSSSGNMATIWTPAKGGKIRVMGGYVGAQVGGSSGTVTNSGAIALYDNGSRFIAPCLFLKGGDATSTTILRWPEDFVWGAGIPLSAAGNVLKIGTTHDLIGGSSTIDIRIAGVVWGVEE